MTAMTSPAFSRYFSLGRHALAAAFQLILIEKGDCVLVPAFICRDILSALKQAGAIPVFYPVTRDLTPEFFPEAEKARAVLAVNYFGFPQPLKPFRELCDRYGTALIEDNAHGFLSRDENGRLLGSRGDVGITSIRKTLLIPDGAVLSLNRPEWMHRLLPSIGCSQQPLPKRFFIKRAVRSIQSYTGFPLKTAGGKLTRYFRKLRTGYELPQPSPEVENVIPGDPAIHCVSLDLIRNFDEEREVKRRIRLYDEFHDRLSAFDIEPVFKSLPRHTVPYLYPFRADQKTVLHVMRLAQNSGFDCIHWPDLPTQIAGNAPDHYLNVWGVNFL